MPDFYCVVMVGCLIIGFILGRWRVKEFSGEVIVSADAESYTFALDIPADDIPQYRELVFRVVTEEKS